MIHKTLFFGVAALMCLPLTGCESWGNIKQRVASMDLHWPSFSPREPVTGQAQVKMAESGSLPVIVAGEGCPQIDVVSDLTSLHQFETPGKPDPSGAISGISIVEIKAACTRNNETSTVAVDMDVYFDGHLGEKAMTWADKTPNFAYPYFVAVTTPDGAILGKEIFAASPRYEEGQRTVSLEENLHQVIPLPKIADVSAYKMLVGFQLTDEELAYNRSLMAPAVEPAAREMPMMETEGKGNISGAMSAPAAMKAETAPEGMKGAEDPVPLNAAPVASPVRATVIEIGPDGSTRVKQ